MNTNDSSELCDRTLDREIMHAELLQAADAPAAAREWTRLDRKPTDLAIWIPYTTTKDTDFVSPHVGNYQYHPLWGVMLDQVWVR